jgi:hypothetical protein
MSPTGPGEGDPRARLVEDFTAELARAVSPHAVGGVLGEAGRRAALLVDRVVRMHLPGAAGACPDCRLPPDRPCGTWAVIADVLAGWAPEQVDAEYNRLAIRYPATVPALGDAVNAANDRVHVMVQMRGDRVGSGRGAVARADEPLRLAREQVVYAGVEPGQDAWPVVVIMSAAARSVAVGGRRFAVREPARRRLTGPAERSSVTVSVDQVYDITEDGDRGWVSLLMLPRDVTEFRVIEAASGAHPRERKFQVHPPSRGRPVG